MVVAGHISKNVPSHIFNPNTPIPSLSSFQLYLPRSNRQPLIYQDQPLLGRDDKPNLPKSFLEGMDGRDFVVQGRPHILYQYITHMLTIKSGELLRGYLFIVSPSLRNQTKTHEQPVPEPQQQESSEVEGRDIVPLQMGEHLRLVEFYKCFGEGCSLNVDLEMG